MGAVPLLLKPISTVHSLGHPVYLDLKPPALPVGALCALLVIPIRALHRRFAGRGGRFCRLRPNARPTQRRSFPNQSPDALPHQTLRIETTVHLNDKHHLVTSVLL